MNLNKTQLIGRITKDPELKVLPSGVKVTSFGLATSRTWVDQDKQKQEKTEFHNVVAWGRQAEIICEYLHKGSLLYVEGRLETRSWEGKEGTKQYRTEVVIETLQLPPRSMNEGSSSAGSRPASTTSKPSRPIPKGSSEALEKAFGDSPDSVDYPEEDINVEDIPF